jgi:hypothetical protein
VTSLFRHNNPLAIILLAVLSGLPLFHPWQDLLPMEGSGFSIVHDRLLSFLSWMDPKKGMASGLFGAAVLLVEALYLNKVVSDNKLIDKPGLLPALGFLLFSGLSPYALSPLGLVCNALLIIIFKLMILSYKQARPFQTLFLSGFLCGIMASFHTTYLILYIWLIIATLIMRPLSAREWLLSSAGFIMPFYFLTAGLYLTDQLVGRSVLPTLQWEFSVPAFTLQEGLVWSCMIILPLMSLAVSGGQLGKMVIQVRKSYLIILVMFLLAILVIILHMKQPFVHFSLLLIPSTLLFIPFFNSFKRDYVPNLLILGLLALALLR